MIRLASRVVVALWILAYLAWSALAVAPLGETTPATARVQPVAEEPPRPASAPARPRAPARPVAIEAADVDEGGRLLDASGAFPVLSCTYEDFRSFGAYAGAMGSLGARFVVVRARRILAEVDVASGRIEPGSVGSGFSPRARDYTGEPELRELAGAVRARFGPGAVVMMLVPRAVDAGLFGAIARALAERDDRHDGYREIRGRYERGPGGGVQLRVDGATRLDGSEVALDWVFDLSAIARSYAGAPGPSA